eukprot:SAG31_NODE_6356_length_2045_cov_10.681437_1_plen_267_part_10
MLTGVHCDGCRYCAWLPVVTKSEHGCPAREVTQAACAAATLARRKGLHQEGDAAAAVAHVPLEPLDQTGFGIFSAEYHPAAVAVSTALLKRTGGTGPILEQLWTILPAARRRKYAEFSLTTQALREGPSAADHENLRLPDAKRQKIRLPMMQFQEIHYLEAGRNWNRLRSLYLSHAARAIWLPEMCDFFLQRKARRCEEDCDISPKSSTEEILTTILATPGFPDTVTELRPVHFEVFALINLHQIPPSRSFYSYQTIMMVYLCVVSA